jgi:hypothetical protein
MPGRHRRVRCSAGDEEEEEEEDGARGEEGALVWWTSSAVGLRFLLRMSAAFGRAGVQGLWLLQGVSMNQCMSSQTLERPNSRVKRQLNLKFLLGAGDRVKPEGSRASIGAPKQRV